MKCLSKSLFHWQSFNRYIGIIYQFKFFLILIIRPAKCPQNEWRLSFPLLGNINQGTLVPETKHQMYHCQKSQHELVSWKVVGSWCKQFGLLL